MFRHSLMSSSWRYIKKYKQYTKNNLMQYALSYRCAFRPCSRISRDATCYPSFFQVGSYFVNRNHFKVLAAFGFRERLPLRRDRNVFSSFLSCRMTRKVDYNRLKVVFERDVAHVGNNLQLQRNDNDEAMYLGRKFTTNGAVPL